MKKTIHLFLFLPLFILSACQSNEESVSISKEAPVFVDEADGLHYVILKPKPTSLEPAEDENLTAFKAELTTLIEEDPEAKLRVSMIVFEAAEGVKEPLLVIRRFENLNQATAFVKSLEEKVASHYEIESILPIAQANYRLVLKEKSLDSYQSFAKKQISSAVDLKQLQ